METFVWLSQWHSICTRSIGLSLCHSNTWQFTNWKRECPMEIPLAHWMQWTNKIPMDISRSIGSNGHFRLAISIAQYLHEVHGLVITSFKYMVIDQLKKQTSGGNSTCPLDPMDKQNSHGHFQVHCIHWIQWILSFGYLNGRVSTWGPWACQYVIQIHINWPTEIANVRLKFHMSIGFNGQTKFQWTFPGSLDPWDPMDTFVWVSQWHSVCMRSMGLSLRHSNTW
jgi:hypothetical protein